MSRLLGVLVLWCAACGTEPDSRPVTFDVVVYEVLAPSCGQVQCHSTTTNVNGYALDTLDAARTTLSKTGGDRALLDIARGKTITNLEDVITSGGGNRSAVTPTSV